jgi:uncharacterized protein involved in exopolysaccharide biosynthesis
MLSPDLNPSVEPARLGMQPVEETSAIEVVNVLLRRRRLMIALPIVFALAGVTAALLTPRKYTASASFMPQSNEGSGGAGGAAALARQYGLNLGSERPGYSPQFYANLILSRGILRRVVETKYPGAGPAGRGQSLIEMYEAPVWYEAIDKLKKNVGVAVGKETDVVDVRVSTVDPRVSEQVLAQILELLNEFNLAVRRQKAVEEVRFTQARLDEFSDSLNAAESALKTFLDRNRQVQNPQLQFELQRLERQVGMRQEVYTSLSQSLEQQRIEAARDMPVLTIIDHPEGSARKASRGTARNGILGLVLGLFVAATIALLAEHYRRVGAAHPQVKREFRQLARDTLSDLRRPSRIFRVQRKSPGS